jgi:hypothetical protein
MIARWGLQAYVFHHSRQKGQPNARDQSLEFEMQYARTLAMSFTPLNGPRLQWA